MTHAVLTDRAAHATHAVLTDRAAHATTRALFFTMLLTACGGATHGAAVHPEPPCGGAATCDALQLRDALAAARLDDGRIAIAAYDTHRHALVLGTARGPSWDPHTLRFTSIPEPRGGPLAIAHVGDPDPDLVAILHAQADPPSVAFTLVTLGAQIQQLTTATYAPSLPTSVALAHSDETHRTFAAWVLADGTVGVESDAGTDTAAPVPVTLDPRPDARIALGALGPSTWLARASTTGIELLTLTPAPTAIEPQTATEPAAPAPPPPPLALTHSPATALAMHGAWLVWTDDDGVHAARADDPAHTVRIVDDATRPGDPAHHLGAALSIDVCEDDIPLVAYQDQTTGALLTAHLGDHPTRQEVADPHWTAAFQTAVACPVILDLSAHSPPLRMVLRAH